MKRSVLVLAGLSAALFTACSGNGPSNLKVHEVALYGGTQEKIVWVYGSLNGSGSSSVKLGGTAVDLRPQVQDALATPGSLSVNGRATYRVPTEAMSPKLSLTRNADGSFNASTLGSQNVAAVYYTDGVNWSKLSAVNGKVMGTAVNGLQGAGQLTDAEADVIGRQLIAQAPLAVAVLSDPTPGLSVEPNPTETLRTSLYILPSVQTLSATTPLVPLTPSQPAPVPANLGDPVNFTEVASGTNAAGETPLAQVANTAADARDLYARAYARQTPPVAAPALASNQTLVGVFIGQRSTGGYGVRVTAAHAKGSALTLTVSLSEPKPGSITTQALTNPWTMVTVPGRFTSVKVVDSAGQPLF